MKFWWTKTKPVVQKAQTNNYVSAPVEPTKSEPYIGSYQKVKKCFGKHYYENLDLEVCSQCGRTKFKVVIARPIGEIFFSLYSLRPNILSWEEAPKYNDKECKCKSTTS